MSNLQKQKRGTKAAVQAAILQAGEIALTMDNGTNEVYIGNKETAPGAGDKFLINKPSFGSVNDGKVTAVPAGADGAELKIVQGTGILVDVTNPGGTAPIVTVKHADTSSQASVDASGNASGVINKVTIDGEGHVTALSSKNLSAADVGAAVSGHNHDAVYIKLSGGTFTGTVVLNADPANPLEPATKQYVDGLVQGLTYKTSVRAATTANITLSGAQTIDGVVLAANDRVLVKNQTTANQNGLYEVKAGAWTRCTDADANPEVKPGMFVFVCEGTAQADTGWVLSTDGVITVGTTALSFTQFSAAGIITAGDGLQKVGNEISLYFPASGSNYGTADFAARGDHNHDGDYAEYGHPISDHPDIAITTPAEGDILYRNSAGNWVNLPKGSNGQVLKMGASVPAWGADNNTTYTGSSGVSLVGSDFRANFTASGGDNGTATTVARGDHTHSAYLTANSVIDGGTI